MKIAAARSVKKCVGWRLKMTGLKQFKIIQHFMRQ